jgi:hypothetical protein
MLFTVSILLKTTTTNIAQKGTFSCMYTLVSVKNISSFETLMTDHALERPLV